MGGEIEHVCNRRLPPFSSVETVSARAAMIDRFELEFGDFALVGDEDDICFCLNHLSYNTIPTAFGERVVLFNSGNLRNLRSKVDVRFANSGSGPGQFKPRPVLAGGIKRAGFRFGRHRSPRRSGERIRVSFKVWLNLTRFVQAQRFRKPSRSRNPSLATSLVLAIHPRRSWFRRELALLPADNLLVGSAHPFGFALRHTKPQLIEMYLSEFEDVVVGLLREQMLSRGVEVREIPYRSLQAMDVYWEFLADDPIAAVDSITQPLHRLSSHVRITNETVARVSEETRNQSRCVTVDLTKSIRLRVYAKTTRRVRFEVEFSGDAVSSICGGRTASTTEAILGMTERLVARAVEEINWVLAELRYQAPQTVRDESVVALISKVARTLNDTSKTEMVISSLHTFGRIAPEGNESLLDVARQMKKAGVLRTIGGRSLYVPADTYDAAVRSLMRTRRSGICRF